MYRSTRTSTLGYRFIGRLTARIIKLSLLVLQRLGSNEVSNKKIPEKISKEETPFLKVLR